MSNLPFDLTTNFTSALREVPKDKQQFSVARQFLIDEIKLKVGLEAEELREKLSLLGYVCRLLDRPTEARDYTEKALTISSKLNKVLLVVIDQLRLASCYQAESNFEKANEMFLETIKICESYQPLDEVIDFAYQQYGQCLYQQGNTPASREYFQMALEVRVKKGSDELQAVSKLSIDIADSVLKSH